MKIDNFLQKSERQIVWSSLGRSLWIFLASSLIVLAGLLLTPMGQPGHAHQLAEGRPGLVQSCFQMDALHYRYIVLSGYGFDEGRRSPVAFFPFYPLLCRAVMQLSGLSVEAAMLLVANVGLLGAMMTFHVYLRRRFPEAAIEQIDLMVLLLGLLPTGMFARMPYAESWLMMLALLALLGMRQRWPLLIIAACVALATATRPVGVALLLPLGWHVLRTHERWPERSSALFLYLIIGASGLLAYMAYLAGAFGDPLAFAWTQEHWFMGSKSKEAWSKWFSLLTLEPIWGAWWPDSVHYWGRYDARLPWYFSLLFANAAYFILGWSMVGLGWLHRWLTVEELLLAAGLLLIPYVTRSYEMSMASMGRFVSVVVPMYISLGFLLAGWPRVMQWSLMTWMALGLGINTFLYALNYLIF